MTDAAPRPQQTSATQTSTTAQDPSGTDQDLTQDLIDEVSIDGMCGVY